MDEIHDSSELKTERVLDELWKNGMAQINSIKSKDENWKTQILPLSRIKKIMKIEELISIALEKDRRQKERSAENGGDTEIDSSSGSNDRSRSNINKPTAKYKPTVKFMVSTEAPVLMSKACELLIREITCRAWQHSERNRRKTLQRQDLHAAVGDSEVFDFLIDIVPRATMSPRAATARTPQTATAHQMTTIAMPTALDPQQQQQLLQQQTQITPPWAATFPPPPHIMMTTQQPSVMGTAPATAMGTAPAATDPVQMAPVAPTDFAQIQQQMQNNQLSVFYPATVQPTPIQECVDEDANKNTTEAPEPTRSDEQEQQEESQQMSHPEEEPQW